MEQSLKHLPLASFALAIFFPLSLSLPANPGKDLSKGKQIYSQVCFYCHGNNLEGGKGPALNDAYWRHGSSPEAILKVINDGVPGTEMIGYKKVLPVQDIQSLLSYLLSQQQGVRELKREEYADVYFDNQELTPELFAGREASNAKPIPENLFWVDAKFGGGIRYHGKYYAHQDGEYIIQLYHSEGRTVVYVNDQLISKTGTEYPKNEHFMKPIYLKKGVYELEILHESKRRHGHRIVGRHGLKDGPFIQFHGTSLQGSLPKVVMADPQRALVVRKWVRGIPPRTLLCLLSNNVIVAYNLETRKVVKAWNKAKINQTPSLPDRSALPSVIQGKEIQARPPAPVANENTAFLGYRVDGSNVIIRLSEDGEEKQLIISPKGTDSYTISF